MPDDTSSPDTDDGVTPDDTGVEEPTDTVVIGPATSLPPRSSAPNADDGAPDDALSDDALSDAGETAPSSSESPTEPSNEFDAGEPSNDPGTLPSVELDASTPPLAATCSQYSTYDDPEPFVGLGLDGMNVWSPSLSADRLELFVAVSTPDDEMIYVARRSTPDDDFSAAEPVSELNTPAGREGTPAISADGLTLAFYSTRESESRDLWLTTRPSRSQPFAPPIALDELNTPEREHLPWLSPDGLTMLYTSDAEPSLGKRDIRIATRTNRTEPFIGGVQLAGANSELNDDRAAFNATGLIVYFASDRGETGSFDLWYASRSDLESEFESAQRLVTQNTDEYEEVDVTLGRDNLEILYVSDSSGENQVLHARRTCLD